MPAREAIKIVADALGSNLQTKLNALSVVAGERAPTIQDFRDAFRDDEVLGPDDPLVITDLAPEASPTFALTTQGQVTVSVPIEIQYVSGDPDTAEARATASYAIRAIVQVLGDILGTTENSVQAIQIADVSADFARFEGGRTGAVVRCNAQMRDLAT